MNPLHCDSSARPTYVLKGIIASAALAILAAACGGDDAGNNEFGNAQDWCPAVEDYVNAVEDLDKKYRDDASLSTIQDARDRYSETRDLAERSIGGSSASLLAYEDASSAARGLLNYEGKPDGEDLQERYDEYREDFSDAVNRLAEICK